MRRRGRERVWPLRVLVAVLALVLAAIATAPGNVGASSVTTTSVPQVLEARQAGWTTVSASSRGVMADFRDFHVDGAIFRAFRLRARTTFLRWHVGGLDPNAWASAPSDAGPRIDWPVEGPAGVVAVFNGAFKQSAKAGGAVVDGVVLINLVRGYMTIALDRYGHWAVGAWGATNFPPKGFHPISYRQNLEPMVLNGAPTAAATSSNWHRWGSPLNYNPLTARTGLGVDAAGNLVYVATMNQVMPITLARALVAAGVVTGMELDINPFWPIAGMSVRPMHAPGGAYVVQVPSSQHDPTIYATGWQRDFFVALAEPNTWRCQWQSPGVRVATTHVQPQPLALAGRGCNASAAPPRTPTTATTTSSVG